MVMRSDRWFAAANATQIVCHCQYLATVPNYTHPREQLRSTRLRITAVLERCLAPPLPIRKRLNFHSHTNAINGVTFPSSSNLFLLSTPENWLHLRVVEHGSVCPDWILHWKQRSSPLVLGERKTLHHRLCALHHRLCALHHRLCGSTYSTVQVEMNLNFRPIIGIDGKWILLARLEGKIRRSRSFLRSILYPAINVFPSGNPSVSIPFIRK